ncbi:MAG: hypothetical protein JKX84_11220 [Flavobacteriales bacterium]|nr:hypothetical protein [Flavobacteriales bacterium]
MAEQNFVVFRKYTDIDQAKAVAVFLTEREIQCKLLDNSPSIDITFSLNNLQNQIELKVEHSEFEKAESLLNEFAAKSIEDVEENHYLFDFSNEELYEIQLKPDEWSSFDLKLSEKILRDRGQEINPDLLNTLRQQRLKDLAQPEEKQKGMVIAGYVFAILGGLIGLLIGWLLYTSKKTLPNGDRVHTYIESDQLHGRNIFMLSLMFIAFWMVIRIKGGF